MVTAQTKGGGRMFAFEYTVRYIENNLERDITPDELARHSGYSKHHFCRLFKQSFGQTVGSYIKKQRLLRIVAEIQSGKRAIDAALFYGYETYAGFYKAFVRMFGCSPSVYVKEHGIDVPINIMEDEYMDKCETARCTLSLLCEDDLTESIRLLTDADVREYLGGPISEAEAFRRLRFWLENGDSIHYAVRLKESGALIGIIAVAPHHNAVDKEVSYQFLPEYWGKGYASEAVKWTLDHCRDALGLSHVVAETQVANARSCRLLEHMGFVIDCELVRFGAQQRIYKCCLTSEYSI